MNRQLFDRVIQERILDFMPPIYHEYTPTIQQIEKVNETKDALTLEPQDRKSNEPVPMIYLDDMYEVFREDEDLDELLRFIANIFMNNIYRTPPMADPTFDFSRVRDKVVLQLIDRRRNARLLETLPHTNICGMAAIYRIMMRLNDDGMDSVVINEGIMKDMGLDVDELHMLALENTAYVMEPEIITLDKGAYMVTNKYRIYGAANMMLDDIMNELAEKLDDDRFFIIPCSMHEFIAVPQRTSRLENLKQMLAEGNRDFTEDKDILSNEIYAYDRNTGKLQTA